MAVGVRVDDDFVRFGPKSYAINKINSVEVRERKPHGRAGAILFAGLGGLVLLGALASMASPQGFSVGSFVLALILGALAYWQWQRAKVREYLLFLMTSSSETQAFVTRDENEITTLRDDIEAAIACHSRGAMRA